MMGTDTREAVGFVVEVTHPHRATDQDDVRVECNSLGTLAEQIDEAIGCGVWAGLEIATDVARGEDFEAEDTETGRVVSARRIEVVGQRPGDYDLRRIVNAAGGGIVTVLDELGADRLEALGIEGQLDPEEARREAREILAGSALVGGRS